MKPHGLEHKGFFTTRSGLLLRKKLKKPSIRLSLKQEHQGGIFFWGLETKKTFMMFFSEKNPKGA